MESPTTVLCKISASQTPTCEKLCGWDAAPALELSFISASVGIGISDVEVSSINAIPPRQRLNFDGGLAYQNLHIQNTFP